MDSHGRFKAARVTKLNDYHTTVDMPLLVVPYDRYGGFHKLGYPKMDGV